MAKPNKKKPPAPSQDGDWQALAKDMREQSDEERAQRTGGEESSEDGRLPPAGDTDAEDPLLQGYEGKYSNLSACAMNLI